MKKLVVVTLPDNTKFYVWWCTGDWWVSCRKLRTEPKPKKNRKQNQNRTDQPPRPIDLWCVRRISQVRDAHSNGEGEVLFEWGNIWVVLEIWADFLISLLVLYGIAWFGVVWYGLHGCLPTISSPMSHRWKESKSYHFDKQEYATWFFSTESWWIYIIPLESYVTLSILYIPYVYLV